MWSDPAHTRHWRSAYIDNVVNMCARDCVSLHAYVREAHMLLRALWEFECVRACEWCVPTPGYQ